MEQTSLDLPAIGGKPEEKRRRPSRDDDNTLRLLGMLAGMGCPGEVLSVLTEMAELDVGDADQEHWLHGPLVVHDSAWNADLPDWMKRQAKTERFVVVAGELPGHLVGPTEIACVMFGRSMDAPMPTDMAEMYLWASRHAVRRHYGENSPQARAASECSSLPDEAFTKPGGRYHFEYGMLCREIRRKVSNQRRKELAAVRRQEREEKAKPAAEAPPRVQAGQFHLFG